MNPIYFKKIELTKPARSDVGIVAKWIEEDWVSEYLFPFGICKGVVKGFFESIYCNDSDPAIKYDDWCKKKEGCYPLGKIFG